ncbi:hypothetical protein [Mesohalobacter halotolerans]|uniref:Uncharacterized protein n=1 Tax=Mesohalobacter halotolerans TaxID=1883405 RepID=A0A4U5TSL5_9FLAO|nr:hypothetical protein [Mesohalobacter halotolerans]MBS3737561.1 hypothetical protein [Psychroflexus sp.]TKS57317.1 hypothetical protein FCN74_02545 [Mesohalobacter halotolerans]
MRRAVILLSFISVLARAQGLPEDHFGHYKGKLQIFAADQTNTVDMEFKLQPTPDPEVYNYVIIYHTPKQKDVRKYLLKAKDSLGNFVLDEQNGIAIPTKYINRSLHAFFEVQSKLLKNTVRFKDQEVEFEISVANTKIPDTTSTADLKYQVLSYPVKTYQYAKLVKH